MKKVKFVVLFMLETVFLGLGSNLGPSKKLVEKALQKISELDRVENFVRSSLFMTSPVSSIPQPDFVNAVCRFQIKDVDPLYLYFQLAEIEKELGKLPKPKDAPRLIDIDLLLFGSRWIQNRHLTIPHPKMLGRLFVLKPLQTIQNHLSYPVSAQEKIIINLDQKVAQLQKLFSEKVEAF